MGRNGNQLMQVLVGQGGKTSVPRSHLCRENSEEAASHLSAHSQIQQILHLVSLKNVRRLLHTYLRTVSQLNIDCLAVFDQSLDGP